MRTIHASAARARSILSSATTLTGDVAHKLHMAFVSLIGFTLVVIALMWVINITIAPLWNAAFFFVGVVGVITAATSPAALFSLLGVSIVYSVGAEGGLRDNVPPALKTYLNVIKAILMYFMVVAAFLTIWPFSGNPAMFWLVAVASTTVGFAQFYWDMQGKTFYWVITIFTVTVIIVALGGTIFPHQYQQVQDRFNRVGQTGAPMFGPRNDAEQLVVYGGTADRPDVLPQIAIGDSRTFHIDGYVIVNTPIDGRRCARFGEGSADAETVFSSPQQGIYRPAIEEATITVWINDWYTPCGLPQVET